MEITLETLGFTQEELRERVIDKIVSGIMETMVSDEDGEDFAESSPIAQKLQCVLKARIDTAVAEISDKHILPNAANYIENICLQETNKWGEAKGKRLTFLEYLTQRAEAYMTEQVSYDGKSKSEDSYNWHGHQTRLAHMVHKHLHFSIESAMKDALKIANSAISTGIEATVKMKLEEITKGLAVAVAVKR